MKIVVAVLLGLLFHALAQGDDRLINGEPADKAAWPASVYASMGNSRCTATVVGERVLLTAAHCVSNNGTASFKAGGNQYSSKCTHAPGYDRSAWQAHHNALIQGVLGIPTANATADWALCVVDRVVTDVPYENLNQDASKLKVGNNLLMTGYGCIRPGGGGGNDGIYRIGEAQITSLPSGTNYDIVTRGGGALCYGDSGGPAFHIEGNNRWVVSVNSRGNIRNTSYIPSVTASAAKSFFQEWSSQKGVQICGMHASAKGCRGGAIPPTPQVFTMDSKSVTIRVTLSEKAKMSVNEAKSVLKRFLDSFQ